MRQTINILLFAVMMICSTAIYAQDCEHTQQLRQNIESALAEGDCARAQRIYDAWRSEAFANRRDTDIERRIAECRNRNVPATPTTDPGVVINGVRWATRNVGASGTFVSRAEDFGNYFTWYQAQSVCPPGWRVPTQAELQRLVDAGSVWIARNNVNGRLFGNAPNQIFLPSAGQEGLILYRSTAVNGAGIWSFYWSNIHSMRLTFTSYFVQMEGLGSGSCGLSVRCVAQ